MITLKDFLFNNSIDCHYHGFGRDGIKLSSKPCIYYINNDIKYCDENLYPYFEKFLKDNNPKYLGIIGKDITETKRLLKDFSGDLIGEVKVYKKYVDSKGKLREYNNIEFLKELCTLDNNLPIILHYDLTWDNYKDLQNIIEKYPSRKFVLCHCGMNELFNKD